MEKRDLQSKNQNVINEWTEWVHLTQTVVSKSPKYKTTERKQNLAHKSICLRFFLFASLQRRWCSSSPWLPSLLLTASLSFTRQTDWLSHYKRTFLLMAHWRLTLLFVPVFRKVRSLRAVIHVLCELWSTNEPMNERNGIPFESIYSVFFLRCLRRCFLDLSLSLFIIYRFVLISWVNYLNDINPLWRRRRRCWWRWRRWRRSREARARASDWYKIIGIFLPSTRLERQQDCHVAVGFSGLFASNWTLTLTNSHSLREDSRHRFHHCSHHDFRIEYLARNWSVVCSEDSLLKSPSTLGNHPSVCKHLCLADWECHMDFLQNSEPFSSLSLTPEFHSQFTQQWQMTEANFTQETQRKQQFCQAKHNFSGILLLPMRTAFTDLIECRKWSTTELEIEIEIVNHMICWSAGVCRRNVPHEIIIIALNRTH